jgi:hypothetical protein
MRKTIRVLSVRQPYAFAISCAVKMIETRAWQTKYRGWIAIHASLAKPQVNFGLVSELLPTGGVICFARLSRIIACRRISATWLDEPVRWPEFVITWFTIKRRALGHFGVGQYAWIFDEIAPCDPYVPLLGQLGLRNIVAEVDRDGRPIGLHV